MTAQTPERFILNDRPVALYEDPLYGLLVSCHMTDFARSGDGYSTACWRCYVGTWGISNGRLFLLHLNVMWPDEKPLPRDLRERLLGATGSRGFPIFAGWFNGTLRLAIGRRLVYSHHGWSHWFARERVITLAAGVVRRDREVDTRAMLERKLRRQPELGDLLSGRDARGLAGPMIWFDNDDDDWAADWWPIDYERPPAKGPGSE